MSEEIVNRVASSTLKTIDLDDFYASGERVVFDMADLLFQGLILREKDFREFVATHDWPQYQNKNVAVFCSADAIIPSWAIMVLITKLQPVAHQVIYGTIEELEQKLFSEALLSIDLSSYKNSKVVIKGCGKHPVPAYAFAELTRLLTPHVASLMYGEPCSTVPVYKKR
jgi:S-adenosylmethionine/arginine decarboxylase-like enzyme